MFVFHPCGILDSFTLSYANCEHKSSFILTSHEKKKKRLGVNNITQSFYCMNVEVVLLLIFNILSLSHS